MTQQDSTPQLIMTARIPTCEARTQRLLPALPPGEFLHKPEEIDRFMVRLWEDGTLYFKGTRERIEEFLRLCEAMGVHVQVDSIALCG